jgi:glucose dehydrogenase
MRCDLGRDTVGASASNPVQENTTMESTDPGSRVLRLLVGSILLISLVSCGLAQAARTDAEPVDGTRIANGDAEARNWLSYGRTYSEQRYSPLSRINADNARDLTQAPRVINGRVIIGNSGGEYETRVIYPLNGGKE